MDLANQHTDRLIFVGLVLLSLCLPAQASFSQFRKIPKESYFEPAGQSLQLPCLTERKNEYCTWLRNGNTKLSGAENGRYEYSQNTKNGDCSLTIRNLTFPADNNTFQCQVPSLELSAWPTTKVVVLVKPDPPQIIDERDLVGIVSDRVSNLTCQSKGGNPPASLEWYLNDENITQSANSFVRGDIVMSSLNYTFKKRNNGSTLVCLSVHPLSNQNTTRVLNVLYKPITTVAQRMYTVNEGDNLDIACQVDSNPPSTAIWKPVIDLNENDYNIVGNKLVLHKIKSHMDGVDFQCSSRNAQGWSEPESIKLNVLYQPRLLEASQAMNKVTLGSPLRLQCKFTGNPKPIVRWNFVDSLYGRQHLNITSDSSEETSGLLIIKNVSYSDEGEYYCEGINSNSLKNEEFIVRSSKFIVNVIGKPQYLNDQDSVVGYRNTNTRIEQIFCSDPPPKSVQWDYAGSTQHTVDTNVKDIKDISFSDSEEADAHIIAGPLVPLGLKSPSYTCFKTALLIRNTDIADARDYTLRVQNSESSVEGIISLQVTSKLSGAMLISISLILLIMLFLFTVLFILLLRNRRNKRGDLEEKSEVTVPINESPDAAKRTDEKNADVQIYANIDFIGSDLGHNQQLKSKREQTEYAKISFDQ